MTESGYGQGTQPMIRMIVGIVIFASVPKELVRMMWKGGINGTYKEGIGIGSTW